MLHWDSYTILNIDKIQDKAIGFEDTRTPTNLKDHECLLRYTFRKISMRGTHLYYVILKHSVHFSFGLFELLAFIYYSNSKIQK